MVFRETKWVLLSHPAEAPKAGASLKLDNLPAVWDDPSELMSQHSKDEPDLTHEISLRKGVVIIEAQQREEAERNTERIK